MSSETQVKLVSSHFGRIILHLACIKRDRKYYWHLKGILRELAI